MAFSIVYLLFESSDCKYNFTRHISSFISFLLCIENINNLIEESTESQGL